MIISMLLFAYFGPETVLPVTSILATIAGLAMMFGRHTLRLIMSCGRLILTGRSKARIPANSAYRGPHHLHATQPARMADEAGAAYDRSAD
jgi:hypothetical protein